MTTPNKDKIITFEYLTDQKFPPVLIVEKKKGGTPPTITKRTAWIDAVNSMTQNILQACKEGEIRLEQVLNVVTPKANLQQKQVEGVVNSIMIEISSQFMDEIQKLASVYQAEREHMEFELCVQVGDFCNQIKNFVGELLEWAWKILIKIVDESFKGTTLERDITSKFFQALIQAFQQTNLVDLIHSQNCPQ